MTPNKLTSRKFLSGIILSAVLVFESHIGLDLGEELRWQLVALVVAYIAGESAVDVARGRREGR
jgi:hypothetical protein